jgi:hypothetical protein
MNIPFPIPDIGIHVSWTFGGSDMKKKVMKKKTKAKVKKGINVATINEFNVPQMDWQGWFGQWLVASMVMEAWKSTGKIPKKFLVPSDAIKDQADGSGLMNFEAVYDE